jgi:hypothetical protein
LVGGHGDLLFSSLRYGGDMTKADYIHLFKEACGGRCNAEYNPCAYRQAADSLAALKPVGVFEYDWMNKVWEELTPNCEGVKLYALDEVTK